MEVSGSDSQEEGWITVLRPKRRRLRSPTGRNSAPARAQSIFPTTTTSRPQNKDLPLFKVKERDMTRSYAAVLRIEQQLPDVRVHAKPNLKGEFVIRPSNLAAVNALRNISGDSLEELKPEEKITKQVVRHYPVHMGLEPLEKLHFVIKAERCKVGEQRTRQVIITCKGKVPAAADLGIFGEFPIRPYNSDPIRCFRCHRYGHHQSTCTGAVICGVCSGRHGSEVCIEKHKQGIAVRARCPNCGMGHHAWNPRCPVRLSRVQIAPPAVVKQVQPVFTEQRRQQEPQATPAQAPARPLQQTPRAKPKKNPVQQPSQEARPTNIEIREMKQAATQTKAPPAPTQDDEEDESPQEAEFQIPEKDIIDFLAGGLHSDLRELLREYGVPKKALCLMKKRVKEHFHLFWTK